MPITDGPAGSKLVLRIFKYHGLRPDTKWVNNYEFVSTGAWTSSDLIQAAAEFTAYETMFHSEFTRFDRWTFSTWAADSKPYDPLAFLSGLWPAANAGIIPGSTTGDMMPLDIVAWVSRSVSTGRQGKLFYRNVIGETMTAAPSGVPIPQGTTLQAKFDDAVPTIQGYLQIGVGSEGEPPLKLALISKTGQVRTVNELHLRGVAVNKRDRQYFDRI